MKQVQSKTTGDPMYTHQPSLDGVLREASLNEMIQERNKLTAAIDANTYRDKHVALYAARQALAWAINPRSAKPPFAMIMDILEEPKDCPVESHPPLS